MGAIKRNTEGLYLLNIYQLSTLQRYLTTQQYKTLRGQILAGDAEGATRGLEKIIERRRRDNATRQSPGNSDRQQPKD